MHSRNCVIEGVCLPVCPSIHPSITRRHCVKMTEHILKLLSQLVAHHSSFSVPDIMDISNREHPNGGIEYKGGMKS